MQLLDRTLVIERMKALHFNQSVLAAKAGCTASMISQYLKEKTNLSLSKQMKLADALGIELNVNHRLLERPAKAQTMSQTALKVLAIDLQEISDQAADLESFGKQVSELMLANNLMTQSRYTEIVGEAPEEHDTPKAV